MARLIGAGLSIELPSGWEGRIDPGGPQPDGAMRRAVVHLANFPLPPKRGDFGSGAVDAMGPGDVLVVLLEYGPEAVETPLFAGQGLPRKIEAGDFSRDSVQRALPGHSGLQRFFVAARRPFCLYLVVGSHLDRADLLPDLNALLAKVEIR